MISINSRMLRNELEKIEAYLNETDSPQKRAARTKQRKREAEKIKKLEKALEFRETYCHTARYSGCRCGGHSTQSPQMWSE